MKNFIKKHKKVLIALGITGGVSYYMWKTNTGIVISIDIGKLDRKEVK